MLLGIFGSLENWPGAHESGRDSPVPSLTVALGRVGSGMCGQHGGAGHGDEGDPVLRV